MLKQIETWLEAIEHPTRKEDATLLFELLKEITGLPGQLEKNTVGFGQYHYVNKTNEGDMFRIGYTVSKRGLTIYIPVQGLSQYTDLLDRLGKHKFSKVCLYITKLSNVDMNVLKELLTLGYKESK